MEEAEIARTTGKKRLNSRAALIDCIGFLSGAMEFQFKLLRYGWDPSFGHYNTTGNRLNHIRPQRISGFWMQEMGRKERYTGAKINHNPKALLLRFGARGGKLFGRSL